MTQRLLDISKRALTIQTHRIYQLPILILMPHSRCNCRCVMCDIWKANANKQELTMEDFEPHLKTIKKLKVQYVAFSGGEALMHSNLWKFCDGLKKLNIKISILSTGLLLKKHADAIIRWCDEIIVSLDGSEAIHNEIRNVPNAYQRLKEGIDAIRAKAPDFKITGRCVLQRLNYEDFPNIIDAARSLRLDHISFLGADVSSLAFNRPVPLPDERVAEIALSPREVRAFREIVEEVIKRNKVEFEEGFIAESPDKIRKIVDYYHALNGLFPFPKVQCNAPWVSAVIEANGDVLPCFFHPKYGNIYEKDFSEIINSEKARQFRKSLDVANNPICKKCVCSLHLKVSDKVVA